MAEVHAYLTQCLPPETAFVAFRFHAPKRFSASATHASSTAVSRACSFRTSSRSANRSRSVAGILRLFFEGQRSCSHRLPLGRRTYSLGEKSTRFNQSLQRQDSLPFILVMTPPDSSFVEHFQLLACCRCSPPPRTDRPPHYLGGAHRRDPPYSSDWCAPSTLCRAGSLLEFLRLRSMIAVFSQFQLSFFILLVGPRSSGALGSSGPALGAINVCKNPFLFLKSILSQAADLCRAH